MAEPLDADDRQEMAILKRIEKKLDDLLALERKEQQTERMGSMAPTYGPLTTGTPRR